MKLGREEVEHPAAAVAGRANGRYTGGGSRTSQRRRRAVGLDLATETTCNALQSLARRQKACAFNSPEA